MDYETPQDLFDALSAPFPSEFIEWRVGPTNAKSTADKKPTRGQPLCYIDARTVMDRLDSICGVDGWQNNYAESGAGSIVCNLGIKMPDGSWIWKADGAGQTDMEAEKGMLSDALKRAAVRFGIGRYLYDITAAWIDLENGHISDAARKKLDELHEKAAQRVGWGERSNIQAYRLLKKLVPETVTDAASAQDFRSKHAPEIALLPVAMRRHLGEILDRIGGTAQEAA